MTAPAPGRRPSLEALVQRFRDDGDLDALGEVFDRAAPALLRIALACTPDPATAEDVLQETFLAAFRSLDRFEHGRPVEPWLAGILRNRAAKARRAHARWPKTGDLSRAPAPGDPASDAEREEQRNQVRRALADLPEPYRSVGLLRWCYGLAPAEIAEVRGESPGTVRSTLSRALAKLRPRIGAHAALYLVPEAPPLQGLDGIRDAVLRGVPRPLPVPTAAVPAAALVTGGLLVGKKLLIAALAVLALAVLAWNVGDRPAERHAGREVLSAEATPISATKSDRTRRPRRGAGRTAEEARAEASTPADGAEPETEVPPEASPEPSGRLDVLVRAAETSQPLANARVVLTVPGSPPVERATGEDGKVSFERVGAGKVSVTARAGLDRVRQERGMRPGFGSLVLSLTQGVVLRGTVLDDGDGSPIAGATVSLLEGGSLDGDMWQETGNVPPLAETRTAADGAFRVGGAPVHALVTIEASAPGYAPMRHSLRAPRNSPPIALRLRKGGALTGTVLDAEGVALEGVTVYLMGAHDAFLRIAPHGRYLTSDGTQESRRSTTDPAGAFRFEGLDLDVAYAVVASPDDRWRTLPVEDVTVTADAPVARRTLTLPKRASLVLRAVTPAGDAIQSTECEVSRRGPGVDMLPGGRKERGTQVDSGRTSFDELPPGEFDVVVRAPGHVEARRQVALHAGERRELDLALSPGASVAGVVMDDRGASLEGVRVTVCEPPGESPGPGRLLADTVSGPGGAFTVGGLAAGSDVVVRSHLEGFVASDPIVVRAPSETIRCVNTRCGGLRMRLVPPSGAVTPSSYQLRIGPPDAHFRGSQGRDFGDGTVEVPNLEPGRLLVEYSADGFAPRELDVTIAAGEVLDLGDLPLDPGIPITGRVVDPSGAPISDARVGYGQYATPERRSIRTGSSGTFRLEGLPSGTVTLDLVAPGFLRRAVRVEAPSAGEITLYRGARVAVRVVDPQGRGVAGVDVRIENLAAGALAETSRRTDVRGAALLGLAPGRYRISAVGDEGSLGDAEIDVAEGEERSVELGR